MPRLAVVHMLKYMLLQQAGDNAKGATAYVTLEPCSIMGVHHLVQRR